MSERPMFVNFERRGADALGEAIPPLVADRLDGSPALAEHRAVVARLAELRELMPTLQGAVEEARREQADADRAAMKAREQPSTKAAERADDLDRQLRRVDDELAVARATIVETSRTVLREAVPHLLAARAIGEERERAALDRARKALAQALAGYEAAAEARSELGWIDKLTVDGEVWPYSRRAQPGLVAGYQQARDAIARMDDEAERRARFAEEAEREREAVNMVTVAGQSRRLQPVPGSDVWTVPGVEPEEAEAVEPEVAVAE